MAESAALEPAPESSGHIAVVPGANEPPASAQTRRPRPVGGLLRPSQVPVPGETTSRTGSPSPAGGRAHPGLQLLRPSGTPAGAALPLARPSAVPARPVQDVLGGSGQPLAAPLREEMQARLGADFSRVRVHTGGAARASAAAVGARAYTSGSHIVIGDGGADRHTLAHELTHVIQQRQGPVAGTDHGSGFKVSDPFDAYEQAAEAAAQRVLTGPAPSLASSHRRTRALTGMAPPGSLLQRAPVAAYQVLAKWPPGTMIPKEDDGVTWKRPAWLRGANGAAMTVRMEALAAKTPYLVYDDQKFFRCHRCTKLGDANGMSVDHLTDWRQACAAANDRQELEELYHEVNNLEAVHTNCNASKGQKDLFEWWKSALPAPYVDNAEVLKNLQWGVEQVSIHWGIDWLYMVPENKRLSLVMQLVEVARKKQSQDVFVHMMEASKLKTMLDGW